ncbi:MAG: hypothetical protein QJR03_06425 [Sphaerobacter sp.]|nr:hypothetical protein [Sphaerobacter sp.]
MGSPSASQPAVAASTVSRRRTLLGANALLALLAVVKLAAHLAVAGNYGYFRDELYYLAAGRHRTLG